MKKYILSIFVIFTFGLSSAFAQSENSQQKQSDESSSYEDVDSDPRTKSEISAQELPAEVRRDITDNYHNPQILSAYRFTNEGEEAGYLVEVKKGTKKWTIEFDKDGNALNKVNPY